MPASRRGIFILFSFLKIVIHLRSFRWFILSAVRRPEFSLAVRIFTSYSMIGEPITEYQVDTAHCTLHTATSGKLQSRWLPMRWRRKFVLKESSYTWFSEKPKVYSEQITDFHKSVSHRKFYAPIQQLITDNPWSGVSHCPLTVTPLPSPPSSSFPTSPSPSPSFLTTVLYKTYYWEGNTI